MFSISKMNKLFAFYDCYRVNNIVTLQRTYSILYKNVISVNPNILRIFKDSIRNFSKQKDLHKLHTTNIPRYGHYLSKDNNLEIRTRNLHNNMNYIKYFVDPKGALNNAFNSLTKGNNNNLKPIYYYCNSRKYIKCKIVINWPCTIEVVQRGISEKEASHKAGVMTLVILSENNLLTDNGKLTLDPDVIKKACKSFSLCNRFSEDLYTKLQYGKKDDNCDSIMSLNVEYDSKAYSGLLPNAPEILNNFYHKVAASNGKIVLPKSYLINRGHYWDCKYEIFWPRNMVFKETLRKKAETLIACANNVINWLLKNSYMNSNYEPLCELLKLNNNRSNENLCQQTDIKESSNAFDNVSITTSVNCLDEHLRPPHKVDESLNLTANKNLTTASSNPSDLLKDFYNNVSKYYNRVLEPFSSSHHSSDGWIYNYYLQWPDKIEIVQTGKTENESRLNCANDVLTWLSTNNYMDKQHRPLFNTQRSNLFSTFYQIRTYSMNSTTEIEKLSKDNEISENEMESTRKQFPLPKQILNNVYQIIAGDLNKPEFKLKPEFKVVKQNKNVNWLCIYDVKWPEKMKFTHISKSKQEASNKAAIAVLTWLQKNGKINKYGRPKLLDKDALKELDKTKYPLIKLNEDTKASMKELIEEYSLFNPSRSPLVTNDDDKIKLNNSPIILKQKFRQRDKYTLEEFNQLPISDHKEQIVNEIKNNQIVIIKGEPGCGKSTRVPQYILDHWAKKDGPLGEPCRIAVTQPRRIAAISLAERVAKERRDVVGDTIGYQVRLKSNFNNNTGRILYCTTGILLRHLQSDPKLLNFTHIILDEAHERDVNTDILLNLLRNIVEVNQKLKVIVMSATLDTKLFQDFFDEKTSVIHVPGFTYPVKSYYLDSCKQLDLSTTKEYCKNNNPQIAYKEVAETIKYIHRNSPEGAILCFLPGWNEIVKVQEFLMNEPNVNVLCLHSRLQMADQWQIFSKSSPGVRKIILSTNIAETSVTIDDVVYVIDTGISKEKTYDAKKGVMCLDNQWISQANINQRIGRAGRVRPGKSYHLYPQSKYNELPKYATPEILRTSLTKVVLDSKVFSDNMDAVKFFAELPTPPETEAIMRAVEDLTDLGLLDENENLTPLGRTISEFQMEPKLAKALINAVIFKCVTPMIDIVTLFSAETELFSGALREKQSVVNYKRDFSKTSDHLSLMRIFEKWLEYVEENDRTMTRLFINANKLNEDKLLTIEKLRNLHFDYLTSGLKNVLEISDAFSDNDELVKGVLLSGVGTVLRHRTWDISKGRIKKSNVLLTRHNHKATITGDSVNYKRTSFPSNYLLYINEVVSNLRGTTLVRESSLISPLSVLLFKNNKILIEPLKDDDDMVLLKMEGTKIEFSCSKGDAELIKQTKQTLESGMEYYIFQLTEGGRCDKNLENTWLNVLHKLDHILLGNSV